MEKLKYYKNLDGLRGIAAMMVLVFHFFSYPISNYIETDIFKRLTEFGQHGVSLFFVLSGFVITRILLNTKGDKKYFKRFYWKRTLRIFPLYYLFLLVFYYLVPVFTDGVYYSTISQQIPFFFYLQNFYWLTGLDQYGPGHYWSLAVEEHFYLIWPLIVFVFPIKYLKHIIFGIIICIIPLKLLFLEMGIDINKNTLTRFDQILLGAILSLMEFYKIFENNKTKCIRIFILLFLSMGALGVVIYTYSASYPFLKNIFKYNILGILFFVIIGYLIILPSQKKINRILESSILQYLGKISYGIYVWHVFVLIVFKNVIVEIIVIDLLWVSIITIIMAHFSFKYFEQYFLKYKNLV